MLDGKNESTCFNPAGIILNEKGSDWKAVQNFDKENGKELSRRCYSCEFHFKKSVNRRLKDPMFNNHMLTFNIFVNKCVRVSTTLIWKVC